MSVVPFTKGSYFVANHGTTVGNDDGNLIVLFVFLGVLASAGWLIFSELRWAHTVAITVGGWAAGLTVFFVL